MRYAQASIDEDICMWGPRLLTFHPHTQEHNYDVHRAMAARTADVRWELQRGCALPRPAPEQPQIPQETVVQVGPSLQAQLEEARQRLRTRYERETGGPTRFFLLHSIHSSPSGPALHRHEQFSRCPSASPPTATAHFGNGPSGCSATSSPGSCFRTSARVLPFTCCRGTAPVCGPAPPSTAGAALHTYDAFTSTGADLCAFVSLPSATATATTCALSAAGAHHLRASAAARARLGGSK